MFSKNRVRFLLRSLITLVLLGWLFRKVPWDEVRTWGLHLSWTVWLETVGLAFLSMGVSAYKWRLLLAESGQEGPSLPTLLRFYLIGLFFNNFLPSGMGGDVVRIALAGRSTGTARAAASVLMERLLAAVGLVLPSLLLILPQRSQMVGVTEIVVLLGSVVLLLTFALLFPGWVERVGCKLARSPALNAGIAKFCAVLRTYRAHPRVIWQVIGWSVVFQGIVILMNYLLLRELGSVISLGVCAVLVPLISALAMVPVSINGLGLREWGYLTLFAPQGVMPSQALAVSLIFFCVVLFVSLSGGVLYLVDKSK